MAVIQKIGEKRWKEFFHNKQAIVQLLMDCQDLVWKKILPDDRNFLNSVEAMSKDYCHLIHYKRN